MDTETRVFWWVCLGLGLSIYQRLPSRVFSYAHADVYNLDAPHQDRLHQVVQAQVHDRERGQVGEQDLCI